MKIRQLIWLLALALMIVSLSACELSASRAPQTTPTVAGQPPTGAEDETMGIFNTILTQTAAAQQAGGGVPPATTPVPGDVTVQPTPGPIDQTQPTQGQTVAQPTAAVVQPAADTPVPPAPVVVPTATPGLPSSHTLEKGEFVYCLARRYNINPASLLAANGLGVNSMVQPGTTLTIPASAGPFPGERALRSHPATYVVGANDTLGSIACYFGDVDPNAIAFANGLDGSGDLTSGQVLQIP